MIDKYFTGTASRIGGVGLDVIAREALARHRAGFRPHAPGRWSSSPAASTSTALDGEKHLWNPETIVKLQHAVRAATIRSFTPSTPQPINDQSRAAVHAARAVRVRAGRARCRWTRSSRSSAIVKRFVTGAMSLRLDQQGGPRDAGHRHEPAGRQVQHRRGRRGPGALPPLPNGDSAHSAIKQVAAARFGVTSEYLVNATELQIKMAQGAKPGEGGQLPGHKVTDEIARVRHSTPGVTLISPPPHHDIYSIEDLAQLIYDLKNANPQARGLGEAGLRGGRGHRGGGRGQGHSRRGADQRPRRRHRRSPADLDQARRHALGAGPGRDPADAGAQRPARPDRACRPTASCKTGRDVVIAALLGAEEFGFAHRAPGGRWAAS